MTLNYIFHSPFFLSLIGFVLMMTWRFSFVYSVRISKLEQIQALYDEGKTTLAHEEVEYFMSRPSPLAMVFDLTKWTTNSLFPPKG